MLTANPSAGGGACRNTGGEKYAGKRSERVTLGVCVCVGGGGGGAAKPAPQSGLKKGENLLLQKKAMEKPQGMEKCPKKGFCRV